MATLILKTKLYVPSIRPKLVSRPRLIEQLNGGKHGKLTLISAPAGFGKTTLVIDWLSGLKESFAWLSLDENDDDLIRFLTYFIAALQQIDSNLGQKTWAILGVPQLPDIEFLITTLINEIADLETSFVLVLEDYHVITQSTVQEAMAFLLEHMPPQMHIIINSRTDPPLPLSRLRASRQMMSSYSKSDPILSLIYERMSSLKKC